MGRDSQLSAGKSISPPAATRERMFSPPLGSFFSRREIECIFAAGVCVRRGVPRPRVKSAAVVAIVESR